MLFKKCIVELWNMEDDAVCFQALPNGNISILMDTCLVLF